MLPSLIKTLTGPMSTIHRNESVVLCLEQQRRRRKSGRSGESQAIAAMLILAAHLSETAVVTGNEDLRVYYTE